jgi:hypothetical protein
MNEDPEISEADAALKNAESSFGPNDVRVAVCLDLYVEILKRKKTRVLDAANMAARAKAIRQRSETRSASTKTAESIDETKQCPFCAERIRIAARICRFCNRNLKQTSLLEQLTQPQLRVPILAGATVILVVAAAFVMADQHKRAEERKQVLLREEQKARTLEAERIQAEKAKAERQLLVGRFFKDEGEHGGWIQFNSESDAEIMPDGSNYYWDLRKAAITGVSTLTRPVALSAQYKIRREKDIIEVRFEYLKDGSRCVSGYSLSGNPQLYKLQNWSLDEGLPHTLSSTPN